MNSHTSIFSAVSPRRGPVYRDQPDLNVPQILAEENVPFDSNQDQYAVGVCCH